MTHTGPDRAKTYTQRANLVLKTLKKIDSPQKADAFVAGAAQIIEQDFANTPQLRIEDFVKILGSMVASNAQKEVADCRQEVEDAQAEGKAAGIELTRRLRAARAAGDQAAERAVWRDQSTLQAACQAKVDAATKRAKAGNLQVEAYQSLASALGVAMFDKPANTPASKAALQSSPQPTLLQQPPAASLEDLLTELNKLTGLAPVKTAVHQLINMARVEQMRRAADLPVAPISRHLVFTGNPGTGKTTVARLLAKLYAAIGTLKTGQLVEVTRADLVAGYVGQTAIKTTEAVNRALGGILFIDEAYSLSRSTGAGQDYGQEAIDTLVKLMEDHRDELVLIAAGYGEEMARFINSNPGLPSRFPQTINFPDYTTDELVSIFQQMCIDGRYEISEETLSVLRLYLAELPRIRRSGNGRLVRNIFESALVRQASRIIASNSSDLTKLTSADLGLRAIEEP